jgi:uncharacterized membrane protein YdbT with pleckstrin-like domain
MPFSKIHFFNPLNSQERVFLVIRKHWIVLAIKTFFFVFILSTVVAAEMVLKTTFPEITQGQAALAVSLVRTVLMIVFLLGLLSAWTMYYLNVQIVTNERVIDINQRGLLHNDTSELNLDKVEDVTAEIKGLLPNLFDYGNVYVQTAGEVTNFTFEQVARPHQVARMVLTLYEKMHADSLAAARASKNEAQKN